jgi:tetratricopeptide (TPR) repeat protein
LFETVDARGVDAAIAQYRELQAQNFPDMYVGEADINALGYARLKGKDLAGAIKIFQLNVEAFPRSANVYDSLGEAYAANGQKELAIKNYQKALSIDTKMKSSIEALQKLTNR